MREFGIHHSKPGKIEKLCKPLGDKVSDGILLLKNHFIEYANSAFSELTGLSPEELKGSDLNLIIESTYESDAEAFLKKLSLLDEQECASTDFRFIKKDGRLVCLRAELVRLSDKRTVAIVKDVTGVSLLSEIAKEQDLIHKNLIEKARLGILIVQDEKIIYANPAVSRISGYRLAEILGSNFTKYLPDETREKIKKLYYQRLSGESTLSRYELEIEHKKGHRVFVEADVSLIKHMGAPATMVILSDITERKKMEEDLRKTLKKLRQAFGGTIRVLTRVAEMKDPYTAGHQNRVADLARSIAKTIGLSSDQIDGLRLAASIHDIGKVVLPAEILSKPGKLSEHEWSLIKTHAQIGYEILKDICFPWPIADIILQHHERLDGSGYPFKLKGEEICIEARILAVADVVEAMSSNRPYRTAFSIDEALQEIIKNRGKLFDERVIDACVFLFKEKGYRFK